MSTSQHHQSLASSHARSDLVRLSDISTTGDWAKDNANGRECADRLVDQMRVEEAPQLLGFVVREIVQNGSFSGVEVGFFHRLAERVCA